jgi:hypothetical protein
MKNIIVVGDSFCSSPDGWPGMLADMLGLKMINFGDPGAHWWTQLYFLNTEITSEDIDNTEVIVFCHTEMNRMPTRNREVTTVNRMNKKFFNNDVDKAVELYYKYISDWKFLDWAQDKWFEDISDKWSHIPKVVHLHSFPWSLNKTDLLQGMNVSPSLASLCLNEVDAKLASEIPITTANHFSDVNNLVLAKEIKRLIDSYIEESVEFDVSKFDQKTDKWLDWD